MIRDVSWSESRASTYSAWRSTENACTTRQQLPLNLHTKMCKLHHGCVVCWCTIRYDQYDVAAAPQSVPMVLRRSLLLPFTEFMNSCVIGPSRDYLGTSRRLPSCPQRAAMSSLTMETERLTSEWMQRQSHFRKASTPLQRIRVPIHSALLFWIGKV